MKKLLRILMVLILTVLGVGIVASIFNYLQGVIFATADYPVLSQDKGFKLVDINGQLHNSNEWIGKVVLINFWATWCPPCRQEIPGFVNLYQNYQQRGLIVVGIAIDELEKVKSFVKSLNINYPNFASEDSGIDLAIRYGNRIGGLPYTVIINREGKVIFSRLGELSMSDAEQIIIPLL